MNFQSFRLTYVLTATDVSFNHLGFTVPVSIPQPYEDANYTIAVAFGYTGNADRLSTIFSAPRIIESSITGSGFSLTAATPAGAKAGDEFYFYIFVNHD